jgi:hypothetical protein
VERGLTSVVGFALVSTAQTGNSPWWGVPVLAGVFTVLGATLSQTVTLFLARSQAKRDDNTRWHSDRLKAYSTLLPAIDRIYTALVSEENYGPPIEAEDVYDSLEPKATTARLIASPAVDKAIENVVSELATVAHHGWGKGSDSINEMHERFVSLRKLMRAELGVRPGDANF